MPTFLTNSTTFDPSVPLHNLTLLWEGLPSESSGGWDGFSLLVDDVERFRGIATNFSLTLLDQSLPHFFRLAVSRFIHFPAMLWLTLTSLSSRKTITWEITPRRRRSFRTGPGLTLHLARRTRLIPRRCILFYRIHHSFLFHRSLPWTVLVMPHNALSTIRNLSLSLCNVTFYNQL